VRGGGGGVGGWGVGGYEFVFEGVGLMMLGWVGGGWGGMNLCLKVWA